jgi:hypothetical protein
MAAEICTEVPVDVALLTWGDVDWAAPDEDPARPAVDPPAPISIGALPALGAAPDGAPIPPPACAWLAAEAEEELGVLPVVVALAAVATAARSVWVSCMAVMPAI